jgi:hypothetical protein
VDWVPEGLTVNQVYYYREFASKYSEIKYRICCKNTWYGYELFGLRLEYFLLNTLHSGNVVNLNVLPSPIPTPLHANLLLLDAMLQVVF